MFLLLQSCFLLLLLLVPVAISSNYDTSMVDRLLSDRDVLIQDGLSYFNGTTLKDVAGEDQGHEVRCIISIENWSRWMLSFPVTYTHYGDFQYGYHEREVNITNLGDSMPQWLAYLLPDPAVLGSNPSIPEIFTE